MHYSYSFSEDLQQEWHWSERFAAQPEILEYLNHVADLFELRKDIQFDTGITSVEWDEAAAQWVVGTTGGETHRAKYFISGAGTLSVPKEPEFPGVDSFAGDVLLTGNYREPYDFTGKRVGIIGTGASGIQAVSEIAKQAAHLTVFQRTPNYATPIGNRPTDPHEEKAAKAHYREIRDASRNHFLGVPYDKVQSSALAVSADERRRVFDERWNGGGFQLFIDSFQDILFDQEANDTVAQYIRDRIHERVGDPQVADLLSPTDHPYGTKRPPLETDYYEAFNRDTVELIDVKRNPIERISPAGVVTAEAGYDLDVLLLATGFDACTGPMLAMNVVGRGGTQLADVWADGPQTYLGLTIHAFPNLFMVTGPQSPSVLYNMPLAIEDHVDFSADAIQHMERNGYDTIEPTEQAQQDWVAQTNEIADATLLSTSKSSWYMGANIPGKPRRPLVYLGGAPAYRQICDDVVRDGYRGFALDTATQSTGISA